jgi:hypothetical protein
MIYYECYHINKSYNFNTKLNYQFNNMEHQINLTTLAMVCVIVIVPKWIWKKLNDIFGQIFNINLIKIVSRKNIKL